MDLNFGAAVFEGLGQMHKLCLYVYRLRSQVPGHVDILLFLPPPPSSAKQYLKPWQEIRVLTLKGMSNWQVFRLSVHSPAASPFANPSYISERIFPS